MARQYQDKTFLYLSVGLAVAAAAVLAWNLFLAPEEIEIPKPSPINTQLNIDFSPLYDYRVNQLSPLMEPRGPENAGRENPFEPY